MGFFLAIAGLAFWIAVAIYLVLMIIFIESDGKSKLGWPILSTVALVLVIYWFNMAPLVEWFSSPAAIAETVAIFLGAGILWSFFRWLRFVKSEFVSFKKNYRNYYEKDMTAAEKELHYKKEMQSHKPFASQNKEQISAWIFFWPFSVLRYIFGDLLVDIGNWIVEKLGGVYNRITNSVYQ